MIRTFVSLVIIFLISACSGSDLSGSSTQDIDNSNITKIVQLTWLAPSFRQDGSELEYGEVIGYAIGVSSPYDSYDGPETLYSYDNVNSVYDLNLASGVYEIQIAAITDHGISIYSDAIEIVVD